MRFDSRGLVSTYLSQWMPTGDSRVSVAGYFGGGEDSGGGYFDKYQRFAFPSDTRTQLTAVLSTGTNTHGAMANSGTAGYFVGGINSGGNTASAQKLLFSAETNSVIANALNSGATRASSCAANSGVAGYSFGGNDYRSAIDKLTFSTDVGTTIGATITTGMLGGGAFSNQGVAVFNAGGLDVSSNLLTGIDKLTTPAEVKSVSGATLSVARRSLTGFSDATIAGYMAGGADASVAYTTVDKLLFSTETRSTLGTGLTTAVLWLGSFSDSGVAGYAAGGSTFGAASKVTTNNKFAFPTDTKSTTTALSEVLDRLAGCSNEGGF